MKQIKQWVRNYNKKYKHADVWQETLQQKEEKKLALHQQVVEVQELELAPVVSNSYGQTIFHRDNLGHNGEETQKIRQIYHELEHLFNPAGVIV